MPTNAPPANGGASTPPAGAVACSASGRSDGAKTLRPTESVYPAGLLLTTETRSPIGAGAVPAAVRPKSSDVRSSEIEIADSISTATDASADTPPLGGGSTIVHGRSPLALFLGAAAAVARSEPFWSASVQPLPARKSAVVAPGAGAAPLPS